MYAIRVDANDKIATGHLMRCLSIATQLVGLGHEVVFICSDNAQRTYITNVGFSFISLESTWNSLENEIEKLACVIKDNNIKCLLIDSYYVTLNYLTEISKYTLTAYIDDMDMFTYHVDLLINYNINYQDFSYEERYKKTALALGSRYAPVRPEFMDIPTKAIGDNVKNIIITTGGSDENNVCGKITERLIKEMPELYVHIVVGKFFIHKESIFDLANRSSHVIPYENAMMCDIMKGCDLALSAGGSTVYELCACGVPTVLFSLADNQMGICEKVHKDGIMMYVGSYNDAMIDKIIETAIYIAENPKIRKELSRNAAKLIDGCGAKRIAEALITLCSDSLRLHNLR